MKIAIIAGARPNFMKIAPIVEELDRYISNGFNLTYNIVHTGQHFDKKMSGDFFIQLNIPTPSINLEAGGGTQAEQTASIMIRFEEYLQNNPVDLVIVVGDVTSTLACAITAKKAGVQVVHVEGGLRSGDLSMPEEINRIVTDSLSDLFFTTSENANDNLKSFGFNEDKIVFVGNTMIDTLIKNYHKRLKPVFWDENELCNLGFFLVTLHRPSNVDDPVKLNALLDNIIRNCGSNKVVFPVHPRTSNVLKSLVINDSRLIQVPPQSYLEFVFLLDNCCAVITDSGGITEECTFLKKPCITLRDTTERPETVEIGTNVLIGSNLNLLGTFMNEAVEGNWKNGKIPEKWDGYASKRIVESLVKHYQIESLKKVL